MNRDLKTSCRGKRTPRTWLTIAGLAAICGAWAIEGWCAEAGAPARLREEFRNPPFHYQSRPLWFWNGKLDAAKTRANSFGPPISDVNVSYFAGLTAEETKPQSLLTGDSNILGGGGLAPVIPEDVYLQLG